MSFSFDPRTRFPLLLLPEGRLATGAALDVGLWPVAKVQYEMFLASAPIGLGSAWYESVLALNERVSANRFVPERREGLWMTGVKHEEALAFCRWLGEDFDLPTVDEWRAVDKLLFKLTYRPAGGEALKNSSDLHPAAKATLGVLLTHVQPRTVGELLLLKGGVFEWVRDGDQFLGLGGRTRPEFLHTIFNPQAHRPVKHFGERSGFFGFRVVRRRNRPLSGRG